MYHISTTSHNILLVTDIINILETHIPKTPSLVEFFQPADSADSNLASHRGPRSQRLLRSESSESSISSNGEPWNLEKPDKNWDVFRYDHG